MTKRFCLGLSGSVLISRLFACLGKRGITLTFVRLLQSSTTPRCHRRPRAIGGGSNRCDAVLGSLVALLCCFDVPNVGFEGVSAAADAHFCKVADCILRFGEACSELATKTISEWRQMTDQHQLHVQPIHTPHSRPSRARARLRPGTTHKGPS